jgi:hypothetical protein
MNKVLVFICLISIFVWAECRTPSPPPTRDADNSPELISRQPKSNGKNLKRRRTFTTAFLTWALEKAHAQP